MKSRRYYNPEIKQKYMNTLSESAQVGCRALFDYAHIEEEKRNKDLALFTKDELLNLYSYINTRSINTLVNYHSAFKKYVRWYRIQYTPVIPYDIFIEEIDKAMLFNYINNVAVRKRVVTRETIFEWIDILKEREDYHPREGFVLLGSFEGIGYNDRYEMAALKERDLFERENKYYVRLQSRDIEISKELYDLGKESANTHQAKVGLKNGTYRIYSYGPLDAIIKFKTDKRNGEVDNEKDIIKSRYRISKAGINVLKKLGVEKRVSIKSIIISGEIEYIKQKAYENNMQIEEYIYSKEFEEVCVRYNISQTARFNHVLNTIKPYL